MKVSVLMPAYNTPPRFLREAIGSVLRQTFADFEFLILNDSPQNGDVDRVIGSFDDRRIRLFRNDRTLGIADAHNFLLDRAQGEYLAMMDHDDISRPERLARQVAFMDAHPDVGICSVACRRFGRLFKRGTVVNPADDRVIRAHLLFQCPLLHPASMMRRSLMVERNLRWDPQFISANDVMLYLGFSRYAHLANLTDVLYDYRMHVGQTSCAKGERIRQEGRRYHAAVCAAMGLELNAEEAETLNDYVLCGRCVVESRERFRRILEVLDKIEAANAVSEFCDPLALSRLCAHRRRSRFLKLLLGLAGFRRRAA